MPSFDLWKVLAVCVLLVVCAVAVGFAVGTLGTIEDTGRTAFRNLYQPYVDGYGNVYELRPSMLVRLAFRLTAGYLPWEVVQSLLVGFPAVIVSIYCVRYLITLLGG